MSYIFLLIRRPSKLPKFPGYGHVWRSSNHLSNSAKLSAGVLFPKKKKNNTNSLGILYSMFLVKTLLLKTLHTREHGQIKPGLTWSFSSPPPPRYFTYMRRHCTGYQRRKVTTNLTLVGTLPVTIANDQARHAAVVTMAWPSLGIGTHESFQALWVWRTSFNRLLSLTYLSP